MKVDYTDIPPRVRAQHQVAGFEFTNQPRWNIPEAVVIKVAVVGRPPGRKGSPTDLKGVIEQSMQCVEAGACCVHYHAVGETAQDWERDWYNFTGPIKEKYGNDVIFDLSICTRQNWEDEMYLIKAMAGICEFTPVNMSLVGTAQGRKIIQAEVQYNQENGIKPEIACYCDGDIDLARTFLIDTGIAQRPTWWDLLPTYWVGGTPMYNEMAMAETLINQVRQVRQLDPTAQFMLTGSGRASSFLVAMSMMLGLHIKVGMEDVYFCHPHKDDVLEDNVKSVTDAVALAKLLGRRPATANEFRAFAGLPQR